MRKVHPHTSKTKKRSILFFEIGLICALSFALWAFNLSSYTSDVVVLQEQHSTTVSEEQQLGEIDMVPDEEAKPIEAAPEPTDLFQIVDNTTPVPEPSEPIEPSPIIPISDIGVIKVNVAPVIDPGTLIDEPVIFASQMPTFPGGEAAMMKFIQENVNYPSLAIENLIQGRVTVLFIIEKDGSISNVEVVRSLGWGLDTEAIRVVKSMPKWIPGENNFRPVRVKIALPIKFVLG